MQSGWRRMLESAERMAYWGKQFSKRMTIPRTAFEDIYSSKIEQLVRSNMSSQLRDWNVVLGTMLPFAATQSLHLTNTSSVLKRCVQVLSSNGVLKPVS